MACFRMYTQSITPVVSQGRTVSLPDVRYHVNDCFTFQIFGSRLQCCHAHYVNGHWTVRFLSNRQISFCPANCKATKWMMHFFLFILKLSEHIHRVPKKLTFFTVVSTNVNLFPQYLANSILKSFATQQLLTCPPHLRTVATLPWEILILSFWIFWADLFHRQSCLNYFEMWRWNLINERFSYCCTLPWCWAECWLERCFVHLCHYCDADIFLQGSVPARWCVHQTFSYCSVKLRS